MLLCFHLGGTLTFPSHCPAAIWKMISSHQKSYGPFKAEALGPFTERAALIVRSWGINAPYFCELNGWPVCGYS